LTTTLNYGVIEPDGTVCVRIIYDHRVFDGAVVARALVRLEEVLNGPLLDELRGMAGNAQVAA
jgi:pyruvate/2-oxoglutarate dehydrogenase complex dihydrolipoamide acyltransferase (E2) component